MTCACMFSAIRINIYYTHSNTIIIAFEQNQEPQFELHCSVLRLMSTGATENNQDNLFF